jgi:thymidylate kinase
MNLNCPDIRRPDGCIFFDMEPRESMKRILSRGGECELEIYETVEQQQRIRAQYRRALAHLEGRDRIYVIDAAGTIEEVAAKVWEAYQDILANT